MNTVEIIRNNLTSTLYQGVPIAGGGGGSNLTLSNIGAGSGVFKNQTSAEAFFKTLIPGSNIEIVGTSNTLTIGFTGTAGSSVSILGLATSGFVTGISGILQTQINDLYPRSNPSGYLTGFNSGLYITTGQTGQFYPASNPNNYSTSGNLQSTGSNLDNKINSLSGYSNNNFATITSLAATGTSLQNQVTNLNNNTGNYYLNSNPNQYIRSGDVSSLYATISNLQSTGSILDNKINSLSGNNYYLSSNPNAYSTSGNLQSTGITLYNLITNSSGLFVQKTDTGNYSGIFYPRSSNPSGYITSDQTGQFYPASNPQQYATSGNLQNTGITLNNKINSLSGYVNSSFSAVYVTGSNIISNANLTGFNGINVFYSGGYICITGGSSAAAGGGTNVRITGSSNLSSVNFTGINGISVILSGNFAIISGTTYVDLNSVQTLTNKRITSRAITYSYATEITPDSDSYDIINISSLTGNITILAPIGAPTDGQKMLFRQQQGNSGGYYTTLFTGTNGFSFCSNVNSGMFPFGSGNKWEWNTNYNLTESKWRVNGIAVGF